VLLLGVVEQPKKKQLVKLVEKSSVNLILLLALPTTKAKDIYCV
jgi:hypothetical protein